MPVEFQSMNVMMLSENQNLEFSLHRWTYELETGLFLLIIRLEKSDPNTTNKRILSLPWCRFLL